MYLQKSKNPYVSQDLVHLICYMSELLLSMQADFAD